MKHPSPIVIPVIVVTLSLVLAACASDRNDDPAETVMTEEEKVEQLQGKRLTLTRRRDQEDIEAPFLVEAPETGVDLGWGWNTFQAEPIPTVCIEFRRGEVPAQTTTLSFKEVSDSYELMRAMDISATVSVKSIGYQAKGSARFAKESQVSGQSTTYAIEAEVLNGAKYAGPTPPRIPGTTVQRGEGAVRLTPEAAVLAEQNIETFKEICGNGYISATMGGAKLVAIAKVETVTSASKEAMKTAVSGSSDWGAKVSVAMKGGSASGEETENFRREISFYQTGGKGQELPTDASAIKKRVTALAREADRAEQLFQVAVTPYEILENWPRVESIIGEETEFEELVALWGAYNTLYDEIQHALEEPAGFVVLTGRSCSSEGDQCRAFVKSLSTFGDDEFKSFDTTVLKDLETLQDEVLATLDRLELDAERCITNEEKCTFASESYRSPYAIRAQLPVLICFLYDISRVPDRSSSGDELKKRIADLTACSTETEMNCDTNTPRLDCTSLKRYVDIQIGAPAKSRCKLGSLTPGCLSNKEISEWGDRVGMRSIVERPDVLERAETLLRGKTPKVDMLWGDPGSDARNTIWVEKSGAPTLQCLVEQIAAERARAEVQADGNTEVRAEAEVDAQAAERCLLSDPSAISLQQEPKPRDEPSFRLADWAPIEDAPNANVPNISPANGNAQHYVQLAALSGEAAARDYWDRLPRAIVAKARGLETRFEKTVGGQTGRELHLVQIGGFGGEESARAWCADLLSVDIDCMVVLPK